MTRQFWPISNCIISVEDKQLNYPVDVFQAYYFKAAPKYIVRIIDKWIKGKDLTEKDYYLLIKKLFSFKPRKNTSSANNIENLCGVYWANGWMIIEEKKYEIEKLFIRYSLGKILDEHTCPLINKYFPQLNFNWELYPLPEGEERKLLLQIKIAFMFSLYNYINYYESKPDRIGGFLNYFLPEMEKRLVFINQIWLKHGESIEYIPIFEDDFRHFSLEQEQFISNVIFNIFINESTSSQLNKIIEEALIQQAKMAIEKQEPLNLQPLIIKVVSLQKSKEFLQTALLCYEHGYYNSTVNRCYYAMLRCARALLSTIGHVKPWKGKSLRSMESHEEIIEMIELKLIKERNLLPESSLQDFKKVLFWRMLADYAEEEVKSTQAFNMYKKASKFYKDCLNAIAKIGGIN